MILAGLDLSLTSTGLVVLNARGEGPTVLLERHFRSKQRGLPRLLEIATGVRDQRIQCGVDDIAIEGYAFSSRTSHAHESGELGGVVRMTLSLAGFSFWNVPPASLKKFVAAKGNAKKEIMHREAHRRWGYLNDSSDLVDGYSLARMLAAHYGEWERKTDADAWNGTTKRGRPAVERVLALRPAERERRAS